MFGNAFTVWHLVILLVVVGVPSLIVWLVVRAVRSSQRVVVAPSAESRMVELDRLFAAGRISDAEYQAKRAEIVQRL